MRRRDWEAYAASAVVLVSGILLQEGNFSRTVSAADGNKAASVSWTSYGGSSGGDQYSALSQINRTNASKLQQVWFYPAGNNGFRYGSNPLVVDGVIDRKSTRLN